MDHDPREPHLELDGAVYGVRVRGRLPESFRPYLGLAAAALDPSAARSLDLEYREVARLPRVEPVWVSDTEGDDRPVRQGRFALFRQPPGFGLAVSGEGLSPGVRGHFRITPETMTIEWAPPGTGAAHYLFSYALPLWLEARGVPVLHGSAVAFGGRAVAFLGPSGVGKSVLCAELVRLGCRFLADDGLALRPDGEGAWHASPGPPLLRLWPSGLEQRLGMPYRTLPRVHETLEKRQWALTGEAAASPAQDLPLAGVYLLQRRPEAAAPVRVAEFRPRDALVRLLEHGVAAGPAAALGLSADRLHLLADVAEKVPVRLLRFPGAADSAERIRDAVLRDLGHPQW